MGITAERIHDRFPQLTKERSDRYGMLSQQKVAAAYDAGKIQPDLVPVAIQQPRSGWGLATEDEGMRPETTMEGLAALKTPFRPHGRVTAGNVLRPQRRCDRVAPRRRRRREGARPRRPR